MAKLLIILVLGGALIVEVAPEPEPPLLIDAAEQTPIR